MRLGLGPGGFLCFCWSPGVGDALDRAGILTDKAADIIQLMSIASAIIVYVECGRSFDGIRRGSWSRFMYVRGSHFEARADSRIKPLVAEAQLGDVRRSDLQPSGDRRFVAASFLLQIHFEKVARIRQLSRSRRHFVVAMSTTALTKRSYIRSW